MKKGTAAIKARVAGKTLKCTVKVFNKLTASQAEKAVKNYCLKQNLKFYYNNAIKEGNVVKGELIGRENDDEIIIFKTVGVGTQDLVAAKEIYEKAAAAGIGTEWN